MRLPSHIHNPDCKSALLAVAALFMLAGSTVSASTCYGTTAHGRIRDAVQLPPIGKNFAPYSDLGIHLGRNYVHETVRDTVVDAYGVLREVMPDVHFIYGETGNATGGPFKPHRSHQNGLSVDFMVPVRDSLGKPTVLPTGASKKFGYALEFGASGNLDDLRIDFDAIAEHLYQLKLAAKKHHTAIKLVIFDPQLTALLLKTGRGAGCAKTLPFMKAKPWVRHDEHYHVDFAIACEPLNSYAKSDASK
jgi:penicillin-insensitive murein endopeptidase